MILFSKMHTRSVMLLSTLLCCGCFMPEKYDLSGLEDLKDTVQKLSKRGIEVHYQLLDQGGGMVHGNFGGFIDEETAWKQLGEDALVPGGTVSCTGGQITKEDIRLLGKLPRLRESRFEKCAFALGGNTGKFSVGHITLVDSEPTIELIQAVTSSRITLEAKKLPQEHVSRLFGKEGFNRTAIVTKQLATNAFDNFSADTPIRHLTIFAPNFSPAHMKQLQPTSFLENLHVSCTRLDESQLQAVAGIKTLQSFECKVAQGLNHRRALMVFSEWQSCSLSRKRFKVQRNLKEKVQMFHNKPDAQWFEQSLEASFASAYGEISIHNGAMTFKAKPTAHGFNVSDLRFAELGDSVTSLRFDRWKFEGTIDAMKAECERLDNITTVTITNDSGGEFAHVPALAALANLNTVRIEHATPNQASSLGNWAALRRIEISPGWNKRQEVYEGLPHVAEIRCSISTASELETLLLNPNLRRLEIVAGNLSTQDVLNALRTENLQHLEIYYQGKDLLDQQLITGVWPHYEVIHTQHPWPSASTSKTAQPTHIFQRGNPNAP